MWVVNIAGITFGKLLVSMSGMNGQHRRNGWSRCVGIYKWGINMDGSTTEDPTKDVLVATTTPLKSSTQNERFKIMVNDKGLAFFWDNLEVPVMISE
jgi:hypothetical protein